MLFVLVPSTQSRAEDREIASVGSSRARAEQLFLENKPDEAAPEFESALRQAPGDPELYLQLAVVYEQLDRSADVRSTLETGMERSDGRPVVFLHNLGNHARRIGENGRAAAYYERAIEREPDFAPPYRNLANLKVENEEYASALELYEVYLSRNPDSPARESVVAMISRLNELLRAEQERLEAEERAREAARARREALQESVRRSLEESRRQTERTAGGDEGFESIDDDLDIFD